MTDKIIILKSSLGNESSALSDRFQDGILAPPIYTRPSEYEGMVVPQILLSGNTSKIEEWREEKSIELTKKRRPNLLDD